MQRLHNPPLQKQVGRNHDDDLGLAADGRPNARQADGVWRRPFLENLVGLLGELQGLEMPLTLGLELSLARLEILRVLRLSQTQNRD